MPPAGFSGILLICYFLSGCAALIDELLWVRLLALNWGFTPLTMALALAIFMGGLAAGSWLAGTKTIAQPLRGYAYLELGIGFFGAVSPWLMRLPFPWVFTLILIPTALMGATFPLLIRTWTISMFSAPISIAAGRLYAANTAGALLGIVLAGFLLPPILGVSASLLLAASFNIGAALLAWRISRRISLGRPAFDDPAPALAHSTQHPPRLLLFACGLSGMAMLIFETGWLRPFSMALGATNFAFSTILFCCLAGIAIGSAITGWAMRRWSINNTGLGFVQQAIACSALAGLLLIERIPYYYYLLYPRIHESFLLAQMSRFLLESAVILLPCILAGMTLPWFIHLIGAHAAGSLYAANTIGAMLGALFSGIWLLPMLGAQNTINAGAVLNLGSAALLLLSGTKTNRVLAWAPGTLLALLGLALIPSWNPKVLTSGVFLGTWKPPSPLRRFGDFADALEHMEIAYHQEGRSATVTVRREGPGDPGALLINAKPDASAHSLDMPTQLLLGHLPALMHHRPQRALIIGLGSGVTAGAMAQHSSIENIDCVEIEPAMAQAARFFDQQNHRVMDDRRLHVITEDARRYLRRTSKTYDLIISEPSNLWVAGSAPLFTQEAFRSARQRLERNGIFCQWAHAYSITPDDFRRVLKTFISVFPSALLFQSVYPGSYLLLGSPNEWSLAEGAINARLKSNPTVLADLKPFLIDDVFSILGRTFVLDPTSFQAYAQGVSINTDERPWLEFTGPRSLNENHLDRIVNDLGQAAAEDLPPGVSFSGQPSLMRFARACLLSSKRKQAERAYQKAIEIAPNDFEAWHGLARAYDGQGRFDSAAQCYEQVLMLNPNHWPTYTFLGYLRFREGKTEEVERLFQKLFERSPDNIQGILTLATINFQAGRFPQARRLLTRVLNRPDISDSERRIARQALQKISPRP